MKQINYKSDFDFILRLKDGRGNAIGWPDYDWEARFWTTSKVNEFVVSCKGGVCVNCYNDNGEIHVVADNHKLSAGVLNVEFTAEIPNGVYPDDSERIVIPLPLEIELIRAAAPCPEGFEVEVQLPYIKGDKLTYADLTEEDKEDLISPIKEDINKAITQKQDKLTTSSDLSLDTKNELSLTDMAKKRLFIDLWNTACGNWGTYNAETGLFELNGLTDITYEEAIKIYNAGDIRTRESRGIYGTRISIRTNLPSSSAYGNSIGYSSYGILLGNNTFDGITEVLNLCSRNGNENDHFYPADGSHKNVYRFILAKKVIGVFDMFNTPQFGEWFIFAPKMRIKAYSSGNQTFNMRYSSFDLDDYKYLIENYTLRKDTERTTIIVPSAIYAKLTDTANPEWNKVLTDAAAKNISFATV